MNEARIQPPEVLAICRLKQWARDRSMLHSGKVARYRRDGWRERRATENDARLVRTIDFEAALSSLSEQQQTILALVYREGQPFEEAARIARISVSTLRYKLRAARHKLADHLDRLGLL